jgi:hypothetical protein
VELRTLEGPCLPPTQDPRQSSSVLDVVASRRPTDQSKQLWVGRIDPVAQSDAAFRSLSLAGYGSARPMR